MDGQALYENDQPLLDGNGTRYAWLPHREDKVPAKLGIILGILDPTENQSPKCGRADGATIACFSI
jgi:hypothetical protein